MLLKNEKEQIIEIDLVEIRSVHLHSVPPLALDYDMTCEAEEISVY